MVCGCVILLKCSRIKNILDFMQMRAQNGAVFQIFAEEVNFTPWKSHSSQAQGKIHQLGDVTQHYMPTINKQPVYRRGHSSTRTAPTEWPPHGGLPDRLVIVAPSPADVAKQQALQQATMITSRS